MSNPLSGLWPDPKTDSILVSPKGNELQPETKLPFKTAADVAKTVPEKVDWIVPGFVAAGVVTEIDGKLKASGKTTWIAALLRAVLAGALFMGLQTKRAKGIWLTEERPQTFAETLKRAHLEAATDIEVLHWHEVKHLPWPVVMAATVKRAKEIGASIIVVDTIGQWGGLRGDAENSNGAQMEAAAPLQDAAAAGMAVLVPRHERKGGGEVGESGRGGSAFSGAVDIVVAIRRGEGKTKPTVRVLHCLSRFTETPDSLVIDLTEDGYIPMGTSGTVAVLEAEIELLDRMPRDANDGLTLETLRLMEPVIALSSAKVAIKNLLTKGKVNRLGFGKKGDAHRYFLTDEMQVATHIPMDNQQPETGVSDGHF
jgi:hypothetical protein